MGPERSYLSSGSTPHFWRWNSSALWRTRAWRFVSSSVFGSHTSALISPKSLAASKRLGYQRSHAGRRLSTCSRRCIGRMYTTGLAVTTSRVPLSENRDKRVCYSSRPFRNSPISAATIPPTMKVVTCGSASSCTFRTSSGSTVSISAIPNRSCAAGFAAISPPTRIARGNVHRRIQTPRRTRQRTRSLKPSSSRGAERNSASSFASCSSFSRSAIMMIFPVIDREGIPDFFLAAKDDRLHRADRKIRSVAYLPVRQPAGIGHDHHRALFLRQYREKFVEIPDFFVWLRRRRLSLRIRRMSHLLQHLAVAV